MKYFHTAVIFTTAIVLILFCPLTAAAQTTNLYTSVPKQVTLTVKISGNGAVTVNGQTFTKSNSIQINRLEDVTVSFSANAGNTLKSIHLNESEITEQTSNGMLIIEKIPFDTVLTVLFTANAQWIPGNNPTTGDHTPIFFYLLCSVTALILLMRLLHSVSKKENET